MCTCMHVEMYADGYTCVRSCTKKYTHIFIHRYVQKDIHTNLHTNTREQTRTCTHTFTLLHTHNRLTCVRTLANKFSSLSTFLPPHLLLVVLSPFLLLSPPPLLLPLPFSLLLDPLSLNTTERKINRDMGSYLMAPCPCYIIPASFYMASLPFLPPPHPLPFRLPLLQTPFYPPPSPPFTPLPPSFFPLHDRIVRADAMQPALPP